MFAMQSPSTVHIDPHQLAIESIERDHTPPSSKSLHKRTFSDDSASQDTSTLSKRARNASSHLSPNDHRGSRFKEARMSESPAANLPRPALDFSPTDHNCIRLPSVQDFASPQPKPSSLFRFGRKVAASFNPVNVWKSLSQTWDDSKDDLTIKNIEANRNKAALLQAHQDLANNTALSQVQSPQSPQDDTVSTKAAQPARHSRTPKSLFHIRRPSMTNLKTAHSNLVHTITSTTSNASHSLAHSHSLTTLRPSASRKDLTKQAKLTKRVSLLEIQLEDARRELTNAIGNVSTLPEPPFHCERYTPKFQLSRPSFIHGNLPSLPSERLLMDSSESSEPIASDCMTPNELQKTHSIVAPSAQSPSRADSATGTVVVVHHSIAKSEAPIDVDVEAVSLQSDDGLVSTQGTDETLQKSSKASSKTKKRKSAGKGDGTFRPSKDVDCDESDDCLDDKPRKQQRKSATVKRYKNKKLGDKTNLTPTTVARKINTTRITEPVTDVSNTKKSDIQLEPIPENQVPETYDVKTDSAVFDAAGDMYQPSPVPAGPGSVVPPLLPDLSNSQPEAIFNQSFQPRDEQWDWPADVF